MIDKPSPQIDRRRVFAVGGTVGALAAAAAVVPLARRGDDVAPAAKPVPAPEAGGGYRLTAHVQQYYDKARV